MGAVHTSTLRTICSACQRPSFGACSKRHIKQQCLRELAEQLSFALSAPLNCKQDFLPDPWLVWQGRECLPQRQLLPACSQREAGLSFAIPALALACAAAAEPPSSLANSPFTAGLAMPFVAGMLEKLASQVRVTQLGPRSE